MKQVRKIRLQPRHNWSKYHLSHGKLKKAQQNSPQKDISEITYSNYNKKGHYSKDYTKQKKLAKFLTTFMLVTANSEIL